MQPAPPSAHNLAVVILAGGRAQRMQGKDKGLQLLSDTPLIKHVLTRLQVQSDMLLINANRNQDEYARFGLPVIADRLADFPGPLAGIHAALFECEKQYQKEWLAAVPCDTPYIPEDLIKRLSDSLRNTDNRVAIAHDGNYLQPTFCLLHHSLRQALEQFILAGGRKTGQWLSEQPHSIADFSDQPEAFMNINTLEELQRINRTPAT